MKQVIKGIRTKFRTTNTLNTALKGRMYFEEGRQRTVYPYAVCSIVSQVADETMGRTNKTEELMIQFDLFSDSSSYSQISDLFDYLTALFDDCSLTITGYTHCKMERQAARPIKVPESKIWHYEVEYLLVIEY